MQPTGRGTIYRIYIPDLVGENVVIDDDALTDTTVLLRPANGTTIDIGSLTIDAGDVLNVRFDSGTLNVNGGLSNSGTISHNSSPSSNARTVNLNVSGTNQIFNTSTGVINLQNTSGRNRVNVIMTMEAQNQNDGSISATLVNSADRDTVRFRLENSGTFTNNGTVFIQDTQSSTSSYSQFELLTDGANVVLGGTGSLTLDVGTLADTGRARIYGNGGSLDETLTNGSSHTINGAGQISSNINVFVNDGLVNATGNTASFDIKPGDSITNSASGRMIATGLAGLSITDGSVAFVNNGLLEARTGSSISIATTNATINGELAGAGTFSNTMALTGSATLSPGDSVNADGTGGSTVGTLNFSGDLILADTTELNFQLGSNTIAGTDYDIMAVTGALTLDGVLNISELAGFGAGTYRLITFSSGELTDNSLVLGATPSSYTYELDINNLGGYVDLNVVPEPASFALLIGVSALLITARRRPRAL